MRTRIKHISFYSVFEHIFLKVLKDSVFMHLSKIYDKEIIMIGRTDIMMATCKVYIENQNLITSFIDSEF